MKGLGDIVIKKLTPASICSQKKWGKMPILTKNKVRKTSKDTDKDGVPDKYDCHPKNKRRQESFLPDDAAYLKQNKSVKRGKKLGEGSTGIVYEVEGNDNLVVKIASGVANHVTNKQWLAESRKYIFDEWSKSDSYSADKQPLMTPTKAVKLSEYGTPSQPFYGLVRPKVTPMWHAMKTPITDSLIETIRQKLIKLSHDGYMFTDGLQMGLDRAGRPLVFDMGDVELANSPHEALDMNNAQWRLFLISDLAKNPDNYPDLYGNVKSSPSRRYK